MGIDNTRIWSTSSPDQSNGSSVRRLIGLLNRRWGSETGEFSSGFEEEFEIALKRRENDESPAIAMFFAELPAEVIADPGPQLSKVLTFKARIQRERIALYQQFRSTDHLATLVLAFLTNHVLPLAMNLTEEAGTQVGSATALQEGSSDVRPSSVEADGGEAARASDSPVLPALQELSETFKAFDALVCGRPFEALDADRLALIGRAFEPTPHPMGAHLANRLYERRSDIHLSNPEFKLWLRTFFSELGLSIKIHDRTIPGWAVLCSETSSDESVDHDLVMFADDSEAAVARGAIRTMTRLGRRPKSLWPEAAAASDTDTESQQDVATTDGLSAQQLASQTWVGMFKALPGIDAAFDYLVLLAGEGDEDLLMTLSSCAELNEASKDAVTAFIASRRGDFAGLAAFAPSSYSRDTDGLTSLLVSHIRDIPIDALARIARFSKPVLRRLAIERLVDGGAVNEQVVKDALAWKDRETLEMLLQKAVTFPPLGEVMLSVVSTESSKYLEGTEARLLAKLRTPEELRAMYEANPISEGLWQALTFVLGAEMLDEAREMLDTDALVIRNRLATVTGEYPGVVPYIASKYRAIACTLIGDLGCNTPEDATRLSQEVERQELASKAPALRALAKVANEQTLPIIDGILTNLDDYGFVQDVADYLNGGLAVLLADRWQKSEISTLREASVRWLLQQPGRDDNELTQALYDPDPETRIAALDSLVLRLNRQELETLLESYPRGKGTHWYNVVAALDDYLFAPDSEVGK